MKRVAARDVFTATNWSHSKAARCVYRLRLSGRDENTGGRLICACSRSEGVENQYKRGGCCCDERAESAVPWELVSNVKAGVARRK